MAFPAFFDTNVLYGAVLCDTLLRLAEQGAFRPHWSADVLAEFQRNLLKIAGLTREQTDHRISQMERAFPDAGVTGYAGLTDKLRCDPKDRHVLAAAIVGGCQVIVTFNTKDFPPESVEEFGIGVVHPDDFLLDQLDLYPRLVEEALSAQAAASHRPEMSYTQLLGRLKRAGIGDFVDEVRHRFGSFE
jgi:predicted nucleic acid-binding protein